MLTADEKRRINDALTRNNGDRRLACAALNITIKDLKTIINNNKDLKALWGKKPRALLTIGSGEETPNVQVVVVENEALIQARREQEFQKLVSVTGGEGELENSFSLQKAYGRYTEECESLLGGTLVERGIALRKLLKRLDAEIEEALSLPVEELKVRSDLYAECHKQLARIMEVVTTSRLARAKQTALKEAGKSKGKGKTSFGPKTAIVAQTVMMGA